MKNTVHQFKVKNARGNDVNLEDYKGKVLLIVNTASKCGLTPQFGQLEELYKEYKDKGLVVIGFPSNDFADQEPNSSEQAQEFCQINYGVSFPIMEKIHVKGDNQHALFDFISDKKKNGAVNISPKWNFQKYLVDKEGNVIDYYLPITSPTAPKVKKAIQRLLDL
jgi:glutathione peroxidase